MAQNDMKLQHRRWRTNHSSCKTKDAVNSQFPDFGSVVGAGVQNGLSAAGSRTNGGTPDDKLHCPKPPLHMVNGYVNHGYKDRNTGAAPSKTQRKQQGTKAAGIDDSAAGGVSGAGVPGGVLVNGDLGSLDTVALPNNFVQSLPNASLLKTGQDQRRKKKFKRKKRTPPPPPPQEEEDWERESQEVTLHSWDKLCFGVQPYGPEDLLHFTLRDLTLERRAAQDLPLTTSYRPDKRHPRPIQWFSYSRPTEPGQFADAD